MKRTFIFLIVIASGLIIVGATILYSRNRPSTNTVLRLKTISNRSADKPIGQMAMDLGGGLVGETIETLLHIENPFDYPVVLGLPQSSCGCTAVILNNSLVPPKEVIQVKVVMTLKNAGENNQTIFLPVEEPSSGVEPNILKLTALGKEGIKVVPETIDFGVIEHAMLPKRAVLQIESSSEWGTPILTAPDNLLTAEEIEGGVFHITLNKMPPSFVSTQIIITSDTDPARRVSVPVMARLYGAIDVTPRALFIGPIDIGVAFERQITVRSNASVSVSARFASNSRSIHVSVAEEHKEGEQTITVSGHCTNHGVEQKKLLLFTDKNEVPVTVPVTIIGVNQ